MKRITSKLTGAFVVLMHFTAALLFFVLSAQAQPTITAAANPVVVPNGQASGATTITWKAAPDYTYCEIYLSIDNGEWSEFARGRDDSKPATLKLGSSYTFRMMVYEGQQGTPKVITTLTVSTTQGNPSSPPSGGGGLGNVGSDTISEEGPDLRSNAINNVRVEPGPRHIMIRFHGPPNQVPYVAIGRGAPIMKNSEWVFGDNLVGGGFVGPATVTDAEKAKGEYMFASAFGTTFSEDGLEPGRTYYYIIAIPAGSGKRSFQDTGSFVMRQLATTVKVVWERVLILDDSDDLSTGEIDIWFWANYGQPSGKFSDYDNGDADSGHTYNINRTVVVNNAPNTLTLVASGNDHDTGFIGTKPGTPAPLNGPNSGGNDSNVAKDAFDLTKYDDNATVNFTLNAMPGGALNFVIFGRFEITRTTATAGTSGNSENTGTTSSPLQTAPAPEPVKAQGRVKLPAGTTPNPPRSICESARLARARNSPAAPGLEAQCLAAGAAGETPPIKALGRIRLPEGTTPSPSLPICESARLARARNSPAAPGLEQKCLAAKGEAIANEDPVVAEARNAEPDDSYRQGFDIATGIFGDPALGAQGNTATGPGSLGIRDSLSEAGQRGFNASVKLHLSRNYKP